MKDKIETSLLLDYYGGMLTEKQQTLLRYYCDMDYSLAELSSEFGLSRQAAQENISRGIDKMNKIEEKLNLVSKVKELRIWTEKTILSTDSEETKKTLMEVLTKIKEI